MQRQTHNRVIIAVDVGDKLTGFALDGIGSGFVVAFAAADIGIDFICRKRGESDMGNTDILKTAAAADDAESGNGLMSIAGKHLQHFPGFISVLGFAKHFAVNSNDRVTADDHGIGMQGQNSFCLAAGKTADLIGQIIAFGDRFIDVRRFTDKR